MKISLITLLFLQAGFFAFAQQKDDVIIAQAPGSFSLHGEIYHKHFKDAVPPATGYVTDWEDLYSDAEEAHMDSMIYDFETKTGIQIAIVTIDSSMSTKDGFDSCTLRIGLHWAVGQDSSKGVVIGISNSLGIMRIQNGVGVGSKLSDADTQQIVDQNFIPAFEKGQFYQGTVAGLKAIMAKLSP